MPRGVLLVTMTAFPIRECTVSARLSLTKLCICPSPNSCNLEISEIVGPAFSEDLPDAEFYGYVPECSSHYESESRLLVRTRLPGLCLDEQVHPT